MAGIPARGGAEAQPRGIIRAGQRHTMRILVAGTSGLVGSELVLALRAGGHSVTRLVRRPAVTSDEITWDPVASRLDAASLAGFDAAVHLGGEPIAEGRWTREKKRRILESRVRSVDLLARSLATAEPPPSTLLTASATGYYGSRGEETLTEESQPGRGFLAEVARRWEEASVPAVEAGIRTVQLRFGMILSAKGGAFPRLLPPFRIGLGGRLGSGRQYWSWISLEDAVGAIVHALNCPSLAGPVNAVSPQPVTNVEFASTLGRVLARPALLPVPAPALRLVLGGMADELLLASQRVRPARLLDSGYCFGQDTLEGALRHMLRRAA